MNNRDSTPIIIHNTAHLKSKCSFIISPYMSFLSINLAPKRNHITGIAMAIGGELFIIN